MLTLFLSFVPFSKFGDRRFSVCGLLELDNLPNQLKIVQSLSQFKMLLKTHLHTLAFFKLILW